MLSYLLLDYVLPAMYRRLTMAKLADSQQRLLFTTIATSNTEDEKKAIKQGRVPVPAPHGDGRRHRARQPQS
jgi:hypothetical protein